MVVGGSGRRSMHDVRVALRRRVHEHDAGRRSHRRGVDAFCLIKCPRATATAHAEHTMKIEPSCVQAWASGAARIRVRTDCDPWCQSNTGLI
jgi:hypothetical protein